MVKAGAGANDKSQRREVVEGVEKAEVGDQAVLEWKFE